MLEVERKRADRIIALAIERAVSISAWFQRPATQDAWRAEVLRLLEQIGPRARLCALSVEAVDALLAEVLIETAVVIASPDTRVRQKLGL